jgi:hypothetical protein
MKRAFVSLGIFSLLILFVPAFNQEYITQDEFEDDMDAQAGKVISLSPCACKPWYQWYYDELTFSIESDEAYIEQRAGWTFMVGFYIPVSLPHGAVVQKMAVYYTDNSDSLDFEIDVRLGRHNMTSGGWDTLAYVSSHAEAASPDRRVLKDTAIDFPQVGNHMYSYHLIVRFWEASHNVKFHGAKIVLE